MKPLKENEILYLPDDEIQTCLYCGLWAMGAHNIDRVFGFRRHTYAPRKDGTVRVDPIPWCKGCRANASHNKQRDEAQLNEFLRVTAGRPGAVYLIHAVDLGATKIGYTQAHPAGRLKAFQRGCPIDLRLIGYYGADYFAETQAHHQFAYLWIRGEWFQMDAYAAADHILRHGGLVINWGGREVSA